MEFNEDWTKSDNDKLRQMIKEGKSFDEKVAFFGIEKLRKHPKMKYIPVGGLFNYERFINEMKVNPKPIEFKTYDKKSELNKNITDYIHLFKINNIEYVLMLSYIKYDRDSYNIFFTTMEQYEKYNEYIKELDKNGVMDITKEHQKEMEDIAEKETKYNDIIAIFKAISYIIVSFHLTIERYGNFPYSITETNNPQKIKIYRNIINDSFDNVREETVKNNDGSNIYYFYVDFQFKK
jgi:hypothetical protein